MTDTSCSHCQWYDGREQRCRHPRHARIMRARDAGGGYGTVILAPMETDENATCDLFEKRPTSPLFGYRTEPTEPA